MNQDLINYIKQCREQGSSDEQIKKSLLDAGWKEEDINEEAGLVGTASVPGNIPNIPINKLPSAKTLVGEAVKLYAQRFLTFTIIMLIPTLLAFAVILLSTTFGLVGLVSLFKGASVFKIVFLIFLALLAVIIIGTIQMWSMAALIYVIKDYEEKINIVEAYKRAWRKVLSYWRILIIMGTIIVGGYLFFLIPGVVFAIWFVLGPYILVTEDVKGMNALMKSKYYINGNMGKVVWRFLFLGLVFVLVSLIFGIVGWLIGRVLQGAGLSLIITIINRIIYLLYASLGVIYTFLIYKNLRALKGDTGFVSKEKTKITVIIIAILGFVLALTIGLTGIIKIDKVLPNYHQQEYVSPNSSLLPAKFTEDLRGLSPGESYIRIASEFSKVNTFNDYVAFEYRYTSTKIVDKTRQFEKDLETAPESFKQFIVDRVKSDAPTFSDINNITEEVGADGNFAMLRASIDKNLEGVTVIMVKEGDEWKLDQDSP